MDQPNVTTRQQKKNGHGNQQAPAENAAGAGERPTAQSTYLTGFSAEQAQNLTTFVSNAIANGVDPIVYIYVRVCMYMCMCVCVYIYYTHPELRI